MVRGWSWLLLAACSSEGSLEIRVTAPGQPVTRVELFAGYRDENLMAIRPQTGPVADAVWWKRDRSDTDVRDLDPDGEVLFQFQRGGKVDALSAIVVVGYDANDMPIAALTHLLYSDISTDEVVRFDFVLQRTGPVPGTAVTPGLQVWGPGKLLATSTKPESPPDPHACVQVDNVKELAEYPDPITGDLPTSGMIVLGGDPDCDGLVETDTPEPKRMECVPQEYLGQESMTRNTLRCALPTGLVLPSDPVQLNTCVVGGATCVDGPGLDGRCAPSAYCTLTKLCEGCTDCDPYNHQAGAVPPRISCRVYYNANKQLCAAKTRLSLATLVPALGLTCDPARPPMLRRNRDDTMWHTVFQWLEANVNGSGGSVEVLPPTSDCEIDFLPSGGVPLISSGGQTQYLVELSATLSVPSGPADQGRGVLLPIEFRAVPAPSSSECGDVPAPCTLMDGTATVDGLDDPGLVACMKKTFVPGTQVTED